MFGFAFAKKTGAKDKKKYHDLLRIEVKEPIVSPIENDQVLKAYLNLLFRAFKPLHISNVTGKATGLDRMKRVYTIYDALTKYMNSIPRYDPSLLLAVMSHFITFASKASEMDEFVGRCNETLGAHVNLYMCEDNYVSKKTYIVYHDPPESSEVKPAKKLRALALYQVEFVQKLMNTAVTFMQACNQVNNMKL